MGVSVYQNTFAKSAAPTNSQTITGIPFRPKAVIFWHAGMTGTSFLDGVIAGIGFADGTDEAGTGCASEDGSAASDGITLLGSSPAGTSAIAIYPATADTPVAVLANNVTFTADGFTVGYIVNNVNTDTIHYMAIGGDDITNVKVGIQTVGTTTTGNKSYTGVGFRPDFLLTACNGQVKASAIADGEEVAHAGLGISAMKSTTERWAISTASEGGRNDSDCWRTQDKTKCFVLLANDTGTLTGAADFVSFDSDGFTWNYTTAGTNITNSRFIYLAIKGGVWDVGDHSQPAANSTVTTNTNASATLRGVMLFNIGTTNNDATVSANNLLAIGGTDGTRQSMISHSDIDASATMVNSRIQNTANCTYISLANATATSSTTISAGTAQAFGKSSFAIAYLNSDGTARIGQYFAVSETPSGVPQAFGSTNLMFDKQTGGQGTIFG